MGVLLLLFSAGWSWLTATKSQGEPDVALLCGVLAVILGASMWLGNVRRWFIPSMVVLVAAIVLLHNGVELNHGPLDAPLGYENANAAFFLQAAVGGLMLAVAAASRPIGIVAGALSVAFLLLTIATGSEAASALVGLIIAALVLATKTSRVRPVAIAGFGLVASALVASMLLALIYERDADNRITEASSRALDERRLALWKDAVDLMQDHPVTGVGPGRFRVTSETARSDRDAQWAHNEFLQQGSETGIPGFLLLIGFFVWGFWRLGASEAGPPAIIAIAGFTAVGIQACVDYIWHFPEVPLLAVALLGCTLANTRTAELSGPPPQGQDGTGTTV